MKRVLVFFPHNPSPPRTGAHKRCREILAGLRELGCEATLLSATSSTDTKWEPASVSELKQTLVSDVYIYEPTSGDRRFVNWWRKGRTWRWRATRVVSGRRARASELRVDSILYTPPGMRRWFKGLVDKVSPDVIFMNYAHWDRLVDHRELSSLVRVIDTIDMVSLNARMQQAVRESLPNPLCLDAVEDEVLDEGFFDRRALTVNPDEFRVYDRYSCSVAIARSEADLIRRHTSSTQVVLIPMTQEPATVSNTYSGPCLLPIGPNYFNTQGYLYFVRRVLPRVLAMCPSFELHVTGFYDGVIPHDPVEGVIFRGYLPDLKSAYQQASFSACPVFGGTGQQVKIVEAMANGLAVVALRAAAERSPLKHQESGLVADNVDEFAEYVALLWNDRKLCARLGRAARETVAREFSRARLLEGLSSIVGLN